MQSKQYRRTPMALIVICVLLVGVLVWAWAPAKAAPPGQTVPIPTATPPIEVPEATPTPEDVEALRAWAEGVGP